MTFADIAAPSCTISATAGDDEGIGIDERVGVALGY